MSERDAGKSCPSREVWERVAQGTADRDELAHAATHLGSCARCRVLLQALVGYAGLDEDKLRKAYAERDAADEARVARIAAAMTQVVGTAQGTGAQAPPLSSEEDVWEPPQRIGSFRIIRRLGEGAMAIVCLAQDESLDRRVALKILKPQQASSGRARRRFAKEAKAAAILRHPNIIAIHAVGQEGALSYIVMEHVQGRSLQDLISAEAPLEPTRAATIGRQVALALAHAHSEGKVHRDVKPANVLLENGIEQVKVTDFGLVRELDVPAGMTLPGTLLGTPFYMSPEQARGEVADARSDQFSLGAVLYEMLTGVRPFGGGSAQSAVAGVLAGNVAPLRSLNPEVPPVLAGIVQRAMAHDPEQRHADCTALADALRLFLVEGAALPRGRSRRRKIAFAAGACAAAALVVAAAIWLVIQFGGAGKLVNVAYGRHPVAVDGNLDDWQEITPTPWTHGDPAAGEMKLCWREEGLYGAVRSVDDDVHPNDAEHWTDDSVGVFIERDAASSPVPTRHVQHLTFWPAVRSGPGPANMSLWQPTSDIASRGVGTDNSTGTQCYWGRTHDGYTLEFFIPASVLGPAAMAVGTRLNVSLLLRNGSIHHVAAFTGQDQDDLWERPDVWVPVRLAGAAR